MRTTLTLLGISLSIVASACSSPGGGLTPDGGVPPGAPTPEKAQSSVSREPASSVPAAVLQAVVDADNAFAFDMFGALRGGAAGKNLLASPITVSMALAMTYAGAQGDTATQMAKTLHWDTLGADVHRGHNALNQALEARGADAFAQAAKGSYQSGKEPKAENYRVHMVNSVWGEKTYTWEPPFLDVLAKNYGTGVYVADFKQSFDAERGRINLWVSGETKNKINDLLPAGALDKDTRMVLVNAMHLKLPWQSTFGSYGTAKGDFTKTDGSKASADYMHKTEGFRYYEDAKAQFASLPLAGGTISVVVALPKGTLDDFEKGLDSGYWHTAWAGRDTKLVSLELPKFKFTSDSIKLKDLFEGLGMGIAFKPGDADFFGLCKRPLPPPDKFLYINNIYHKAMMGIDEDGVEAAAATAVVVAADAGAAGPGPTPIPMKVDRPFVVAIVDEPTGSVLFLGHISDPTAAGAP